MDSTNREAEMPAIDPPFQFQFPPPLPEDHTDIYGDPVFHGHPIELVPRHLRYKIQAQKHIREWYQGMYPFSDLPLWGLPDPNMQPQYQFTNKIPSFTANQVTHDIIIQERTALDNLPPPRVLPDPNIPSQYQLQFQNKVQNPSFTTNLVRDDTGSPIKVAIYDMSTQSIISLDNFLSSAKVKTIVLDAEFVENKGVTLSRGEFDQSVLRARERKGPILTGRSRIIQLQNGVGTFENIVFNDNSSWTKSGFRLGVMVVSDGEEGYFNGARVQEGVSEPFQVKDRRMKASKPKQLELTHSVKCIKKIGKDRAFLLQKIKINTVNDFLKSYYNDEAALRKILGIKSESSKEWDSMIEHAMQCENEFHANYNALNNNSQPCQAVHPMEGNPSLSTNDGRSVFGCGSSQQNPSDDEDLNEFVNSLVHK